MEPAVLLIIVFIVAPLIERLLKAGREGQKPPQERMPPQDPRQHLPQQRAPGRRDPRERDREPWQTDQPEPKPRVVLRRTEEGDDAAETMLPDDLWEILTGERRTPGRPSFPQPADYEQAEELEEAYSSEEEASLEAQAPGDLIPALPDDTTMRVPDAAYVRPLPVREPPRSVSLEALEIDGRLRHEQFHGRLDKFEGPARVQRPAASVYRFTGDEDLRRAIVMAEILGTPRGLE